MSAEEPRVVGYVRALEGISDAQMNDLQSQVFRAANLRGLTIQALYLDRPTGQTQFDNAVSMLGHRGSRFLVIPSLEHLNFIEWGSPFTVVERLTAHGVEVLIVK
ncbi:hypothetical protein GCM10009534_39290 [Kribbella sandramycini]